MQSISAGNQYPGTPMALTRLIRGYVRAVKPRYVPAIPGPIGSEFQMTSAFCVD